MDDTMGFMEKITPRGALIVVLIIVSLSFCLFIFAVSRNAEINFSRDGIVKIIPKGSERIKELEGKLDKSLPRAEHKKLQERYQQLNDENLILNSRCNRLLAASGVDVSAGEDTAIRKIELLAARSKKSSWDINISLSVIRIEVALGMTINTNSRAMDERRRGLYMDMQKFFRCIGIYNEEINGDQVATCSAVRKFQGKYGLKVDGILGKNTFAAMERAFQEAKSH